MDRDMEREVKDLRNRMAQCFRETSLALELRPAVFLALISLHLIARKARRARDPAKQRELIREFDQGRTVIREFIDRALKESGLSPGSIQSTKEGFSNQDQRAA